MYSIYKNQSLQQQCSLNPRVINRCVEQAMGKSTIYSFEQEPGIFRVCSEQPSIPITNVDVVRRPEAFQRWALPKLYKELHSCDPVVMIQAINSVCDLIHDPEKLFEAIRLKFVNRLGHLMMRTANESFRERILMALLTFASHSLGREEIASRHFILSGFKELLQNGCFNVRCKTAAVVEMLSYSFRVACTLISENFIPVIVDIITYDENEIVMYHLQTLEKLFMHAKGQEQGIDCDAFAKLIALLESSYNKITSQASRCIAMLTSNPEGKKLIVKYELLQKLNDLLHNQNRDIYTAAAEVIMFATHTVESKHVAAEIDGLAIRLLDLSHDFKNPAVQMFAMKALCNMVEHPKIRKVFFNEHLDEVKSINTCDNEELIRYKDILIRLIKWKPWIG